MRRFILLGIITLQYAALSAQFNYNEIVPPSPAASSLGQYGANPVSYYTGTPTISVPLGVIKGRELQVPISLSYMARGIRVEENASWVGTGWTLNATGVITRTVRGLEDGLKPRVTYPLPQDVEAMKILLQNIDGGFLDTEPDVYNFNFPGYSGSFILNQAGEVVLESQQDIRVKKDLPGFSKFTITIENGTQYIFEEAENTTFFGVGTPSSTSALFLTQIISPTGGETISFHYTPELTKYFMAARPKKWARPDNLLNFGTVTSPFGRMEIAGKRLDRITSNFGQNAEFVANMNKVREDLADVPVEMAPRALSEIKFYDENNVVQKRFQFNIEAVQTTRLYAQVAAGDPPANLCGYANYRLYLKSVSEVSADQSNSNPGHVFTYYGRDAQNKDLLPNKLSAAQDHWGYYNGSNNIDLLPGYAGPFCIYDPQFNNTSTTCPDELEYISRTSFTVPGADRKPNESFIKNGTLSSITYPTGGRTVFGYEGHKYHYENNSIATKVIQDGAQLYLSGSGTVYQDTKLLDATITIAPRFIFEFNVSCWNLNTHQPVPCNTSGAQVNSDKYQGNSFAVFNSSNQEVISVKWMPGDGGFWIYRKGLVDTNIGLLQPDANGFISRQIDDFVLREDQYTLKLTRDPDSDSDIFGWLYFDKTVSISLSDPSDALLAGGLRVKSIENFDESNKSVGLRTFDYGAGVLLNKPRYVTYVYMNPSTGIPNWFQYCQPQGAGHNGLDGVDSFPWMEFSCGPYMELGYTQGSSIGYGSVTENQSGNGSISYTYTTGIDYPDNNFNEASTVSYLFWDGLGAGNYTTWKHYVFKGRVPWPFISHDRLDRKRGYLSSVLYKDNLGRRKLVKTMSPVMEDINTTYGIIFQRILKDIDWLYSEYKVSSGFVNIASSSETQTDVNNNSITKTTQFFYESAYHKQLTKQIEIGSNGITTMSEYRYADDYTNISDPNHVISKLKAANAHIIGVPIESRTYSNGVLVGGSANPYALFTKTGGGLFPAISASFTLKQDFTVPNFGWSADPTIPSTTYFIKDLTVKYDGVGHPVTYQTRNQIETSFIWEMGNPSPIAQVVNATTAEIFYASFELNGVIETSLNPAKTGVRYFNSGTFNFSTNGGFTPSNPSELKMSYWYWASGTWNFSGILPFQNAISSGGTRLDDIRVYPQDAQMTTYTYNQYGISSISDANSQPMYYEYDLLGRLKLTKDADKNLLQTLTYHYIGQN